MSYFVVSAGDNACSVRYFDIFGNLVGESDVVKGTVNQLLVGYYFSEFGRILSDIEKPGGAFASLTYSEDGVRVSRDYSGREALFYYVLDSSILISNSAWLIVNHLRAHAVPVVPDLNVIAIEIHPEWIFQQISSNCTFVRGLKFLPAHTSRISWSTSKGLILDKKGHERVRPTDYIGLVSDGIIRVLNELNCIQKHFGALYFQLSGGRDSRCLLSAGHFLFGESAKEVLKIRSATNLKESDLLTAKQLCEKYGYSLNDPIVRNPAPVFLNAEDALNRYLTANAFLYYNFDVSQMYFADAFIASVRGGQVQGSYNLGPPFVKKLQNRYGLDEKVIFRHFENFEPDYCEFAEYFDMHYAYFRYPVHYGRIASHRTMWAHHFDPLINWQLDAANFAIDRHQRYAGRVSRDIMLSLDPSVTDIPFDSVGKNFSADFIASYWSSPLNVRGVKRDNDMKIMEKYNPPIERPYGTRYCSDFDIKCTVAMCEEIFCSSLCKEFADTTIWKFVQTVAAKKLIDDVSTYKQIRNQISKYYQVSKIKT